MANRIIFGTVNGLNGYTATATIDSANDHLLIQQGSTYFSITRNVFLGVSGIPMDISTAQNVTSKTFDNTNQATLKSNKFTLQDFTDTTKQAIFSVAGVTTGTTRTYTLPNASVTLASTSGTEALSNKSVTASSWSGGTIDNATITVDSISGHSTSTIVTVGGVQMNNGVIGTNNAVTTAAVADTAITPAKLQAGTGTGWAWQSWTPTFTNFSIGNGTLVAQYIQTGKTVSATMIITFGTTTTLTGSLLFTPPVNGVSLYNNGATNFFVGVGDINNGVFGLVSFNASNARMILLYLPTATTFAAVDATHPAAFASGNTITMQFEYQGV